MVTISISEGEHTGIRDGKARGAVDVIDPQAIGER